MRGTSLSTNIAVAVIAAGTFCSLPVCSSAWDNEINPPVRVGRPKAVSSGLSAPDGIAVRRSRNGKASIHVSEEDAARIVQMSSGGRNKRVIIDKATRISMPDGEDSTHLVSPEGLAVDSAGRLHVVEDVPGGRLLRFSDCGRGLWRGEVIPLPTGFERFAWEGLAIGPDDELLLAGSDVEAARQPQDLFSGAILYRDRDGSWWQVLRQLFVSFSAVDFSADGTRAVFASELPGGVGWIDLTSQALSVGFSSIRFRSPEGVEVLPNGLVLVAEESGRLILLDPASDDVRLVHKTGGSLESVAWDEDRERIILVDDARGELISVPTLGVGHDDQSLAFAPFPPGETQKFMPEECPDYLRIMMQAGGTSRLDSEAQLREAMNKLDVVSLEAMAVPLNDDDALVELCFAVFNPKRIQVTDEEVGFPGSMLVARYASGKVESTTSKRMAYAIRRYGEESRFGHFNLMTPLPAALSASPGGVVSISFLGLGRTADYHVLLNMGEPEQSYVLVEDAARSHQYALTPLPGRAWRDSVVIAYSEESDQEWVRLDADASGPLLAREEVRGVPPS